jgi:hypothetical protein
LQFRYTFLDVKKSCPNFSPHFFQENDGPNTVDNTPQHENGRCDQYGLIILQYDRSSKCDGRYQQSDEHMLHESTDNLREVERRSQLIESLLNLSPFRNRSEDEGAMQGEP